MKDKSLSPNNLIPLGHFYGRSAEVKRALGLLGKGQSISIVGPPGIGKTMFLRYLADAVKLEQPNGQIKGYLSVYFDGAAMTPLVAMEIYRQLASGIQKTLEPGSSGIEPPTATYKALENTVRQCANQELRIVVCLDNFDSLIAGADLEGKFFSGLRALVMRFNVAFVTASREPLPKLVGQMGSLPFLSLFLPLRLGLLNEVESRAMLAGIVRQVGLDLLPSTADLAITLAGGHPLLLQELARCVVEGCLTQEISLLERKNSTLLGRIRPRLRGHFMRFWRYLNEEQRWVLAYLPHLSDDERCQTVIQELVALCLVVKRDQSYVYFSPLFEEFVRQQPMSLACGHWFLAREQISLAA